MRILTVRQPWAWAIIHGGKDVENRVRNIAGSYRGPVAIHAGLAYDKDSHERSSVLRGAQDAEAERQGATCYAGGYTWGLNDVDPRKVWSQTGHIIGVVDLADVHYSTDAHLPQARGEWSRCSDWAEPDGYHLVLANPRALETPIPWKGALGLRNVDLQVMGDWLVNPNEPCKSPCAGIGYGCPRDCEATPLSRLLEVRSGIPE